MVADGLHKAAALLLIAGLMACGGGAQQPPPVSATETDRAAAAPAPTAMAQPAETQSTPPKSTAPKSTPAKTTAAPKAPPAESAVNYKAWGSKSAPITLEVFSDYQCPACRQLYFETLRPLIQNYVSSGKVYLIHRDMPLPMHPYSRVAARYANAAARLKKLEMATEAIYRGQELWGANGDVDAVLATVLTPAEMKRVRDLVNGGTLEPGIDADVALAGKFRVQSTPTSVLTFRGQSHPITGVMSYSILKQYLDDLLSKK
jgi:protein-disulfide isomerase